MKRYAVLAGSSEKQGFVQKSICCIYDFLKSTSGGAWLDREILILPEGFDVQMLKFILRKIAEDKTDFLFLYFCGNGNDVLTAGGFTAGGTEIERKYIEETCKKQVVVFDTCEALVPADDDGAETCDETDERQTAAARLLGNSALSSVDGGLFLCGNAVGERPALGADGSGLYTAHLIEKLCASDKMLNFTAADRGARFACGVAKVSAEEKLNVVFSGVK